jgi:microcystin-dependent protein
MSVANSAGYHNFPLPVGSVIAYANDAVPATYLRCDGNAYSKTTYPELYRVLGTTYRTGGEAPDEFRVPDLTFSSKYIQGVDATSKTGVVSPATITVANTTFTLTSSNIPTLVSANFGTPTWNITSTTNAPIIQNVSGVNNFDAGGSTPNIVKNTNNDYNTGALFINTSTVVAGSATPTPVDVNFGGVGTDVNPESYEMIYIIKAISSFENFYTVPPAPAPPSFTVFNDVPALSGFINPSPILT